MMPIAPKAKVYEVPFWEQIWESIQYGWSMVVNLLVFIANFWAVLVGGYLLFGLYKWNKKLSYFK